MPEEARIKVSLDLDQANAQLDAFYRRMGGAPGVGPGGVGPKVPGKAPGAKPGPAPEGPGRSALGLGGKGIGAGAMIAGGAVAGTFGKTAIADAARGYSLITEPVTNKVSESIFGDAATRTVGAASALEQVRSAASLAVGYGAEVSEFQPLFNAIADIETKREDGRRKLAPLGAQYALGGTKAVVEFAVAVERFVQGVKGVFGG